MKNEKSYYNIVGEFVIKKYKVNEEETEVNTEVDIFYIIQDSNSKAYNLSKKNIHFDIYSPFTSFDKYKLMNKYWCQNKSDLLSNKFPFISKKQFESIFNQFNLMKEKNPNMLVNENYISIIYHIDRQDNGVLGFCTTPEKEEI